MAMLVGACALYITWDQARVMRAQQHAAVWPILTIDKDTSTDEDNFYVRFGIENAGVGPAILKSAELRNNGEIFNSWSDFKNLLPEDMKENSQTGGSSIKGRALSPGREFRPYGLQWKREEITRDDFIELVKLYDGIVLEVCYCSVFDRCWSTTSTTESAPERIEQCPIIANDIN